MKYRGYVYFEAETIRDFLREHGRGPSSQDYELVVSILLKKFCEDQLGVECVIGFQIQDKHQRDLPDSGMLTLHEIKNILRTMVEQSSPIDVVITKGTVQNPTGKGYAFQLKRFGKDKSSNDTRSLVKYLNEGIPAKYSATENAILFLILESDQEIDLEEVANSLATENYPFSKIMYLFKTKEDNTFCLGELWPNKGFVQYSTDVFNNG